MSLFYVSHKIYAGKPGLAGLPATFGDENACETLELLCEDPVLGLKVTLLYTAFSDVDVITRSVRIENVDRVKIVIDCFRLFLAWVSSRKAVGFYTSYDARFLGERAYVRTPQSKKRIYGCGIRKR